MTRLTEPITITRGSTGLPVVASLVSGMTLAEIAAVDAQWVPAMAQAVADALARGVSLYDLPEHKHWEWGRKARGMGAESRAFGIVESGETQAVMIVRTDKVCRLPGQVGKPLVYVDYIASAPWNLPGQKTAPRFKEGGKQLVMTAIEFSKQLGFDGRLGLHSLPQAESYYRDKFGMTDLGKDPVYEDLRYFELPG